jgi:amino acid permease
MTPFDYKSFITHYIGIPIYVFGFIGYKREYPESKIIGHILNPIHTHSHQQDQVGQPLRGRSLYRWTRVPGLVGVRRGG